MSTPGFRRDAVSSAVPGGHLIPDSELRELWDTLIARGELWNGMTGYYLRERYGDRLSHTGLGWFVTAPGGTREATPGDRDTAGE
jgi:hypothetical protein